MRNDSSPPVIANFVAQAPAEPHKLPRPLFASTISAGFPSPAEDYVECMLDLNEYCVRNAPATFYLRVREDGYSMVNAGIYPGDLLCLDRSESAQNGDIVVALVDGEYTVKEFVRTENSLLLRPHNPDYAEITCNDAAELEIFGEVTAVIPNQKQRHNFYLSAQGINQPWGMSRSMLSPAYTTRWDDLPLCR